MRSHHRHLYALAELVEQHGDIERCRDEYLASLDAADGLVVLLIRAEEIRAVAVARRARAPARCQRCGARLPAKRRHRCSRCGGACHRP
jgi:tRNA(Ile2) C34 agmatinyltransferase TiaS